MVIVMLLAMQIPTEMSKMLKRERRAQEERESRFCSVTTLTLLKNDLPKQLTQTKCRTEIQDEQPASRKAERALPPLPSFKTLVKSRIWARRTIDPPCFTAVCRKPQTTPGIIRCTWVCAAWRSLPTTVSHPHPGWRAQLVQLQHK